MATHNENIENLRSAVYGEQVRSSMIQLFEEDYTMVSKAVGYGTDVTGADSSVEGYSDGNIYINSNTLNVYQTNGTTWIYVGNLKGIASISTEESSADSGTNTVTFTLTDGTTKTFNVKNGRGISSINVTESSVDNANNVVNVNMSDGSSTSFNVKNGKTGAQGDSVTDVIDKGQGKFAFKLSNNTETASTVQAVKGETGDKGAKGDKGDTGRGLTSITSYNSGKQHTLTANYTDGTNSIVCTVRDGADGSAGGDMFKATYDVNDDGVVDSASSLTDGTKTIMVSDIEAKANKATTLSGYGITDALKTPTENGTQGQLLSIDADGNNVWRDETAQYITNTSTEFSVTSKTLSLASGITSKLQNLNESGKISSDNVLDGSSDVSITNKLTAIDTSDYWNKDTIYKNGDMVIYNNSVYVCKNAGDTGISGEEREPTNTNYWDLSSIKKQISDLNTTLANLDKVEDISNKFTQKITMQELKAYKQGKQIFLDLRTGKEEISNTFKEVATFPTEYSPKTLRYVPIVGLDSGGGTPTSYGIAQIEGGSIKMRLNTTGYYVRIGINWLWKI